MLNVDLKKLLLNCTQLADSAKITFPCLVREVEKYNTNANIDFDIDNLYQHQEFNQRATSSIWYSFLMGNGWCLK